MVVQPARQDRVAAAGTAADLIGGFEDGDRYAVLRQGDGGGQSVGPAAHHDCRAHAEAADFITVANQGADMVLGAYPAACAGDQKRRTAQS